MGEPGTIPGCVVDGVVLLLPCVAAKAPAAPAPATNPMIQYFFMLLASAGIALVWLITALAV